MSPIELSWTAKNKTLRRASRDRVDGKQGIGQIEFSSEATSQLLTMDGILDKVRCRGEIKSGEELWSKLVSGLASGRRIVVVGHS